MTQVIYSLKPSTSIHAVFTMFLNATNRWMNKLEANIPTITELLLEKLEIRFFKKIKAGADGRNFLWVERVHSSERWSGKSLRRDPYGSASIWSYWDRTEQAKGTAEREDPVQRKPREKGKHQKMRCQSRTGLGFHGLCRPWYWLGFYSELGEKMWGRGEQRWKYKRIKHYY